MSKACDFCRFPGDEFVEAGVQHHSIKDICKLCASNVATGMLSGVGFDDGAQELARQANYNIQWVARCWTHKPWSHQPS